MKKSILAFYLIVLCCSDSVHAELAWEPYVDQDNAIFPSYIISTATMNFTEDLVAMLTGIKFKRPDNHLGDLNGQIGIKVTSSKPKAKVRVEVASKHLIQKSIFEVTLQNANKEYKVYPTINYDFDALRNVTELVPESISFSVYLNDEMVGSEVKVVQVRSVRDCPYGVIVEGRPVLIMPWMFVAYVNEGHPQVEKILKEALDAKLVSSFKGYQGTPEEVNKEIFAIWYVFQKKGIKYSSITTPSGTSGKVISQHVRLFEDSFENSQANCVDGSVLFASIFRKIGLNTSLALVPGHCFIMVYLDRESKMPMCSETTMLDRLPK